MHKAPVAVFLGSAPKLMLLFKGSEAGAHGGLTVQALSVWISRPMLRWISWTRVQGLGQKSGTETRKHECRYDDSLPISGRFVCA